VKYNEITNKDKKDLVKMDQDLRRELFQLRLKARTSQLEKKSEVIKTRKTIARIQTKLTELARTAK
jgi:large subunit ribosomal protein L29